MPIAQNDIHVRTEKCYLACLAHPELFALMRPDLRTALQTQAEKVGPALKIVLHTDEKEYAALTAAETVLQASRDMISQLHEGVAYRYRHHAEQIQALAPLTLGADLAEDGVRLTTLARELPLRTPKFIWLPDEGLTLDALKKQIIAHAAAAAVESQSGGALKNALKLLRDERPASRRLWNDDGLGLKAWVVATVPKDEQYAFGRERRSRPRPPKTAKPKDGKGQEKKDGAGETAAKTQEASAETKSAPQEEKKAATEPAKTEKPAEAETKNP